MAFEEQKAGQISVMHVKAAIEVNVELLLSECVADASRKLAVAPYLE